MAVPRGATVTKRGSAQADASVSQRLVAADCTPTGLRFQRS